MITPHSLFTHTGIGANICISQEIQCFLYAVFISSLKKHILYLTLFSINGLKQCIQKDTIGKKFFASYANEKEKENPMVSTFVHGAGFGDKQYQRFLLIMVNLLKKNIFTDSAPWAGQSQSCHIRLSVYDVAKHPQNSGQRTYF